MYWATIVAGVQIRMAKKRKATAADMVKMPDHWKIKLWDDHAKIIAEACEFEWVEGEPDDNPAPSKSPPKSPYEKQMDIIYQQYEHWGKEGVEMDEITQAFMWEWAYQQFHKVDKTWN